MKNNKQKFQNALQYMQAKDFNSAKKELNEIIKVDNTNTQALGFLAIIKFQQGESEEALKYANQALFYDSNDVNVTNLRGMIHQKIGNNSEAKKDYEKVISINPDFKEARYNLVKLLLNEQKSDQAVEYLKPLVELKDHNAMLDLAIIYLNHTKKFSESLKLFELFIQGNESDKRGYLGKIRVLNYLNRNKEALICCDEFKQRFSENDIEFLNYKGIIYKEIEQYSNAEKYFKKALEIKDNEKIRRNLSGVYLLNKKFDSGWFYFTEKKNHALNKIEDDASIIFRASQGIGDQLLYVKIIHEIEKNSMYTIHIDIDKRLHQVVRLKFPHLKIKNSENSKPNEIITDISNAPFILNEIAKKNMKSFDDMMGTKLSKIIKSKKSKKIGLAWKSINPNVGKYKSIDLDFLIEILQDKEIHNLQYFEDKSEIELLPKSIKYRNDIDYKNDIQKLYKIMTELDIVITISNFTAHLAGFFDIPTILLIPKGKGNIWYWHNEKESFWYPNTRLVKQKKNGDWTSIKDELMSLI